MLRQEVRGQDKGCDKGSKNKKRDKKSAEKREMKRKDDPERRRRKEGRRQHRQSEKNEDSLDRRATATRIKKFVKQKKVSGRGKEETQRRQELQEEADRLG
jgi:hypothetical protein